MIVLVHLTFVGANVTPAGIEFGDRLTLVRGPSDTGKSFVVDAIDFMLGARELKNIPEREGYSDVLLGILVGDSEYTLMRSVTGGAFGLFNGKVTERPTGPAPRVLSQTHNSSNTENLSMWLLDVVGLAGARLRKNVRNDTESLSFRNLAHLVVVDETQMQSEISPALTGRHTSKTKEISLLKLLLEGDDDSNLVASPVTRDERRLKGARLEVIDQLIANLNERLSGQPEASIARSQVARLNASISATTASIHELSRSRTEEANTLQRDHTRRRAIELRRSQIARLRARFALLNEQYRSDVARLEMIIEGGNLLGYFDSDACPLCGADPEHQHDVNFEADSGNLVESAYVERERTLQLIGDLEATFSDLDRSEAELVSAEAASVQKIETTTLQLNYLDERMAPNREELNQYLSLKSQVESSLSLYEQLGELQQIRARIEDEAVAETAAAATAIGVLAIDGLSKRLSDRLRAWGYEASRGARYDRSQQDVFADNQFRSAHGKGVRAILHAAFSLALADYCFDEGLPHPGFLVLDSPMITYRAPGESEEAGPDRSFATEFYHDLEEDFEGQIIVMENTDPLDALSDDSTDIVFTKTLGLGRYGFFSPVAGAERVTQTLPQEVDS